MKNINYANNIESGLANLLSNNHRLSESNSDIVSPRLVLSDREAGAYLYQANCLEIMDMIIEKYPEVERVLLP